MTVQFKQIQSVKVFASQISQIRHVERMDAHAIQRFLFIQLGGVHRIRKLAFADPNSIDTTAVYF